jgi:hypothetical protein
MALKSAIAKRPLGNPKNSTPKSRSQGLKTQEASPYIRGKSAKVMKHHRPSNSFGGSNIELLLREIESHQIAKPTRITSAYPYLHNSSGRAKRITKLALPPQKRLQSRNLVDRALGSLVAKPYTPSTATSTGKQHKASQLKE